MPFACHESATPLHPAWSAVCNRVAAPGHHQLAGQPRLDLGATLGGQPAHAVLLVLPVDPA